MILKLVAKLSVYSLVTFLPVMAKATENDVNKQEVEAADSSAETDSLILETSELPEPSEADLKTLLEESGFLKTDAKNAIHKPVCWN